MDLTQFALWLNQTFEQYDLWILGQLHNLAQSTNGALTGFMNFVSLLAEDGILLLIIAIALMLFKKTRKVGICMFGAIGCGALITNIWLKDLIARPRPYMANNVYELWWNFVGSNEESCFSFPSGHTTAAMAAMTALFLTCKKKYSWTAFIFVILVAMSRNYLMVHYPSDILGGMLVGAIAGIIAYLITKLIFFVLEKYQKNKFCKFVLDFSINPKKKVKTNSNINL